MGVSNAGASTSALPAASTTATSMALTPAIPHGAMTSRVQPNKLTAKSVPAFLNKLYSMVNDPSTDDLIRWSDDGDSFFVPSADKFGRELLPRFFKHSNFGSFVRQLNMYGFHKVPHLQQGVLKTDSEEAPELLEFSNPNFNRDQPDLLILIKRQKGKSETPAPETSLDLPSLLTDLATVRKHQTALSAELKNLQSSNSALWQEAIQSRERHGRQQDTVNKILRFLASVFGGQAVGNHANGDSPGTSGGGGGVGVGNADSPAESSGVRGDGGDGQEKKGVHLGGQRRRGRAPLLLKDVERPNTSGGSGVQLEEVNDEDDDIEEIPVPERESSVLKSPPTFAFSRSTSSGPTYYQSPRPTSASLPTITSSSSSSSSPNRYPTLPIQTPTPGVPTEPDVQYSLPSDYLQTLLQNGSGNNNNNTVGNLGNLEAFLNLPTGSNSASSPGILNSSIQDFNPTVTLTGSAGGVGEFDMSRAILPSPTTSSAGISNPMSSSMLSPGGTTLANPFGGEVDSNSSLLPLTSSTTSNALSSSTPIPTSVPQSQSLTQTLKANTTALESAQNEKLLIDQRTAALEAAISKLLGNFGHEQKEALLSGQAIGGPLNSETGVEGSGFGEDVGYDWTGGTGENGSNGGGFDFEKMMEQYVNTNDNNNSNGEDSFDWDNPFPPDSALGSLGGGASGGANITAFSPTDSMISSSNATSREHSNVGTPTALPLDAIGEEEGDGLAKKGKKRKSEAAELESPTGSVTTTEGNRRSSRRKKN